MNTNINYPHKKMVETIVETGNYLDYKISQLLKEFKLTDVQFNILKILKNVYPQTLTVGEVKESILFSNCDITRLLDRLVDKKLVFRFVDGENRRKMNISIVEEGLNLLQTIDLLLLERFNNFYANIFTKEEAAFVINCLNRIKQTS